MHTIQGDSFIKQRCQDCYTIGENATIDEMLEGFIGRCNFRQYIPNKPNKYGIKIQTLVDSKTFYTCNMEVYVGTQSDGQFKCCEKANFTDIKNGTQRHNG